MNEYHIIAYATKDTPYTEVLDNYLKPSLKELGIKHSVSIVPNQGNWYKNTAYKAKFILDKMEELKTDVVMVDADAIFQQLPKLFDELPKEYDMAIHYLDWKSWYGHKNSKVKELLSGTIYLRNNEKIKKLCLEWYEKASKTNTWEQKILEQILPSYNLKVYELPIEYCYMKSRPGDKEPLVKCDPVITHYQKSREYKKTLR